MKSRRATIIYNPMSGRLGRRQENVRLMVGLLENRGIEAQAFPTTGPEDASLIARNAVSAEAEIVVGYGGDGTLNEIIQGLAGSHASLAVWPGGTANVVALDLGMPGKLDEIADVIAAGKTRRVSLGVARYQNEARSGVTDAARISEKALAASPLKHGDKVQTVGSLNSGTVTMTTSAGESQRFFLMMAGIGIDALIAHHVNKRFKRMAGELAYWWCGIKHLARRADEFTISVDGKVFKSAFAMIGKGKGYGGGMTLTPGATLEAPEFEVFILPPLRHNVLYLRALNACKKGRPEVAGATLLKGTHIEAYSDAKPWVQLDGEVIGTLPMSFDVAPNSLSLIVP